MHIDLSKILTLWYENAQGDVYVLKPDQFLKDLPKGFIYQHSQFPCQVKHEVYRAIQKTEVDKCPHPTKYIVPTHGWSDGIEGRECLLCNGSQTKEKGKSWPKEWNSNGSKLFMTGTSSWPEDLVLAMILSKDYSPSQAILIATTACERCINVLANKYKLEWGYAEFSDDWVKAKTTCKFCE